MAPSLYPRCRGEGFAAAAEVSAEVSAEEMDWRGMAEVLAENDGGGSEGLSMNAK